MPSSRQGHPTAQPPHLVPSLIADSQIARSGRTCSHRKSDICGPMAQGARHDGRMEDWVAWHRRPPDATTSIRSWFAANDFEEVAFDSSRSAATTPKSASAGAAASRALSVPGAIVSAWDLHGLDCYRTRAGAADAHADSRDRRPLPSRGRVRWCPVGARHAGERGRCGSVRTRKVPLIRRSAHLERS